MKNTKFILASLLMTFSLNAYSQGIINPVNDDVSGLHEERQIERIEAKELKQENKIILHAARLSDAITSLPSGEYDLKIVYLGNTTRKMKHKTKD